ncbi:MULTISPECIES: hypothetical protein [Paenibacillus]|uniref:Uncharacterized protein n=1 Tax=Paenibacillus lautus TaxID=1401 RepID=A0A1R1B1C0_PAELA|nr:hypothetical protein [Paenibacillus lautus]OME92300.1 hypothetical protein BK123_16995 [Paenibacillus lautus]
MIKQHLLFKFNRFSTNEVLTAWENADKSKDVILLESANSEWSIEVDGIQNISDQMFEHFLSKIDVFDNGVQLYCKEVYENSNFKIENFIVSLQWISLLENSITMGYWGDYMNVELRSNIECDNGIWKQKDIYYQ